MPENIIDRQNYLTWFSNQQLKIDPNKKTIGFLAPRDNGTAHFRIFEPMRAMRRLSDEFNLVFYPDYEVPIDHKLDLCVFHVAHHRVLFTMIDMKNHSKARFVYDTDDYFDVPKDHPSYTAWRTMKLKELNEKFLRDVDLVTVTTNELKRRYSWYNKVAVVRNGFDFRLPCWNYNQDWLKEKNAQGKIVVGWAGSPVHVKDLQIMSGFLKKIHDKYPHVHFVIAGLPHTEIYEKYVEDKDGKITVEKEERTENLDFHKNVKEWFSGFDTDRLDLFLRADIMEYGKFYSMFNINLAYTRDDVFSRCKSEIKIIEGLAYNAVPVFSYMGGYKDYFDSLDGKDWGVAVQVDGESMWVRKLSNVLDNYEYYRNYAVKLGKDARENYSIDRTAKQRLEMYKGMIYGQA